MQNLFLEHFKGRKNLVSNFTPSYLTLLTVLISGTGSPGLHSAAIVRAHARPKTTRSSNEFAPSLFAPCTDTQAASPAA